MISTKIMISLQQTAIAVLLAGFWAEGGRGGGCPRRFQGSTLNTTQYFIDHIYKIPMKNSLD
jgi:hypothetical protein